MRVLLIWIAIIPLQGCLIFIPGSVVNGISDSITGSEGSHCVGASVKVGDTIRLPGNGRATVKALSNASVRCNDPALPIRALLDTSAFDRPQGSTWGLVDHAAVSGQSAYESAKGSGDVKLVQ